jgi:hypothetical protein
VSSQTDRVALLRAMADGRREYAASAPDGAREHLEIEAATLDTAVQVMEGDDGPLYAMLPSWRWTPEMCANLDEEVS